MQSADFLLEVGTEEMPARFLDPALEQLQELAGRMLAENRLAHGEIRVYGTPRRLALYVRDLARVQDALVQEVKGPAVKVAFNQDGEPTRAALGFARSQGVDIKDLVVKNVGPVEYVFAVKRLEGRPAAEVLAELCPALIGGLHFPKPMRWGDLDVRFARPIRWLVALHGEEIVPFGFAGLTAGRETRGHRFLCPGPVPLAAAAEYADVMKKSFVLVDPAERRRVIWRQVEELAARAGGLVEPDEELLSEVANLVEYPTALCGSFDPEYLKLPVEVLVTPMREHQRYFPVRNKEGGLLPRFIAVRNGTEEHLDIVRAGNEKVLRARLADAAFFWREDLATPLSERVEALKKVVWQESLGTVYEKTERLTALSRYLAGALNADRDQTDCVLRAARLAKADLVTSMVYEFTELQGVMGRAYALENGEHPAVAQAIFEHYLPRFAGDQLPATLPGRVLSLADKIDTLTGCFAIGIQPTGSQDPYALRRQALGICHIVLDGELVLSLREMVSRAYSGFAGRVKLTLDEEKVAEELTGFFAGRMRGILAEKGLPYDVVEAVLAAGVDDLLGVWQRAQALETFRLTPQFEAVLTAYNRANNLSRKYPQATVDPATLVHPAEKNLYACLTAARSAVENRLAARDYRGALASLTTLVAPVDAFFEAVMVMVEDERVRNNRLGLLRMVVELTAPLADLSKIVGAEAAAD